LSSGSLLSQPVIIWLTNAVKKALQFLSHNPTHPGLRTHEFTTLKGPKGEKVFEAYAEQATPAAYRIFWYYGAKENQITIVAITPHPSAFFLTFYQFRKVGIAFAVS